VSELILLLVHHHELGKTRFSVRSTLACWSVPSRKRVERSGRPVLSLIPPLESVRWVSPGIHIDLLIFLARQHNLFIFLPLAMLSLASVRSILSLVHSRLMRVSSPVSWPPRSSRCCIPPWQTAAWQSCPRGKRRSYHMMSTFSRQLFLQHLAGLVVVCQLHGGPCISTFDYTGCGAAADCAIAGSLVWHLSRMSTPFEETKRYERSVSPNCRLLKAPIVSLINRLMAYAVSTGAAPALLALSSLITFLASQETNSTSFRHLHVRPRLISSSMRCDWVRHGSDVHNHVALESQLANLARG
jgi:hypothetical protein